MKLHDIQPLIPNLSPEEKAAIVAFRGQYAYDDIGIRIYQGRIQFENQPRVWVDFLPTYPAEFWASWHVLDVPEFSMDLINEIVR